MISMPSLQNQNMQQLKDSSLPPINIRSSIWFAKRILDLHGKLSGGVMGYHPESGTAIPFIQYPAEFGRGALLEKKTIIQYGDHSVLILSTCDGCGIIFDTKSRKYSKVFSFEGTSNYDASCVLIGESIHIFNGSRKGFYTIYSMKSKTAKTFDTESEQCLRGVQVIKSNGLYQSSMKMLISGFIRQQNDQHIPSVIDDLISEFCRFELLKFGGWDLHENCNMDSFSVGTLRNENAEESIEWRLVPEWRMKHLMYGFGYIQYGSLILTFGGFIENVDSTDSIYILDLRTNEGWIESPIKCPKRAQYSKTVLDDMQRVHLFPVGYAGVHYWIDVRDLIPQSMSNSVV